MAVPLVNQSRKFSDRVAVIDHLGRHTYASIRRSALHLHTFLLPEGEADLHQSRVAFLVPPDFRYVVSQWAIWLAGGVTVPLCPQHPVAEWEYALGAVRVSQVIVSGEFIEQMSPVADQMGIRIICLDELKLGRDGDIADGNIGESDLSRNANILFTSGTTNRPKGVVTTHGNLQAQIETLVKAWDWRKEDHTLNVLPLHHTHGIVNVLCCALWSGATCEMLPKFDACQVWERLSSGEVNVFMAVPTVYGRLIGDYEQVSQKEQAQRSRSLREFRLMVSGSAALPVPVFEKWKEISGHDLLERYGMTEIGMALANPYSGERRPGTVGQALPSVETRVVDGDGRDVEPGESGELWVRGSMVFKEYFDQPEETAKSFHESWFKTGDVVCVEDGYYRIMGRQSVDIIKSGGYKISALEIEAVLRRHPAIADCAVVGVEDPEWGERVSGALILRKGQNLSMVELKEWAKEHLAHYKIPSQIQIVVDLPRNVLGKVLKPKVKELF
ncbi:MAG: AMP-binding protein [Bdellovibrionaceae bacterium]|nr:AMP-binding protein [Pseudobdellovibrionaceae bacterium]